MHYLFNNGDPTSVVTVTLNGFPIIFNMCSMEMAFCVHCIRQHRVFIFHHNNTILSSSTHFILIIVNLSILPLSILMKSEIWLTSHCLRLGNDTMLWGVYFAMFCIVHKFICNLYCVFSGRKFIGIDQEWSGLRNQFKYLSYGIPSRMFFSDVRVQDMAPVGSDH